MYMTVTPAYGRDYKSAKAAKADWNEGKDFMIADVMHPDCGRYVNKPQITHEKVRIRFDSKRKTCNV